MQISLNSTQFLQVENDIRISATSTFNAQEAYETQFEDVLLEQVSNNEETQNKQNKITFYNLGAPAGFFLDNSLLEEMEASNGELLNQENKSFNPYMMLED